MHDTLHYMQEEPVYRRYHHDQMTFGLVYAWSERFVLPISHDEVVYGKGSLLRKMPGDPWQQFANLRAYLAFMWSHPGKKLLFMGSELGQPTEWNHDAALPWSLLDDPRHRGVQRLVSRPERRLPRASGAAPAGRLARGVPLGSRRRPRPEHLRLAALRRRGGSAGAGGLQLHPGAARRVPDRRALAGYSGARCSTRMRRATAAPTRGTPARWRRNPCRATASRTRCPWPCRRSPP